MTEITLKDLRAIAQNTPQIICLKLLHLQYEDDMYQTFLEIIEMAMDWISQELSRNPELRQEMSEDELTAQVISMLKALSLSASHDTKTGGHCDIQIEGREELLWLAEAKKVDCVDNNWLYKGFEQLCTRYSTGNFRQNNGGLIVYCYTPRIDHIMASWKNYLNSTARDISFSDCSHNPSAFFSSHTHDRTGRDYTIRHLPISLYFEPLDRQL